MAKCLLYKYAIDLYDSNIWIEYSDTSVSFPSPQHWCLHAIWGEGGVFFSTVDSSLSCQQRASWLPSRVYIFIISFLPSSALAHMTNIQIRWISRMQCMHTDVFWQSWHSQLKLQVHHDGSWTITFNDKLNGVNIFQ